ncbi:hypothetical protein QJS10_CPB21g01457 [Acorus calamus]|uniref:Phagocyte signaling-impaired protein n=1 Tax=Acorus calamus TaxID=4465 RepID=A0AAV9C2Q0_ACOCL|nr:hypothetical protein QJS10_CPB21g01457 [Acorus calamus]
MSSKFGLAGGIPERRVRPIWDAVDSRQFKSALKLSTGLLSKYPNSPYALALKALILERMGKPDEALNICITAKEKLHSHDAIHMDDLTLSTLQIVFQRLDRLDLATSCYEYACGKFLNNLELMMGLFNCYVREYSFVKQQQTAIKMYKVVSEERFLLWAVCSIQLQVLFSSGGEKLLQLAEALLKKHIVTHSLHEPEALLIYVSILEQQAKFEAALEVLSGDMGSLLAIEVDRLRIKGRLLARAGDNATAAEVFQKILELCPDDWESFLHYLGCLLEDDCCWRKEIINDPLYPSQLVDRPSLLTEETFDSRISGALSFVKKLQTETNNEPIRCPFLGNIEIERRRRLYGKANDGELIEALLEYFRRFSHMACFTSDVEMFIRILSHNEKLELLGKLMKIFETSPTTPIKKLGQSITVFKVQELIGSTFSHPVVELENNVIQMVEMYCGNLQLSKDLDPQENMHGEELLSMACNLLVQLFWRTRNLGYLLEAIMVLEFGLTIRRFVWQYKILLLHLYSFLGAYPLAYEWFGTLDVKNILLETVSHHILPQMLTSPLLSDLTDLLKEYLKFMDDYQREAADLTFLAYRHRNYSKVIEFVQFKERLQHSHQYLLGRCETSILQLKQTSANFENTEIILGNSNFDRQLLKFSSEDECKSLTFNDDLQSRPWWSPTPEKNYLLEPYNGGFFCQRESLQHAGGRQANVRKVIGRRSLLPRLVYVSIQSSSENIGTDGSIMDNSSSPELKHLLERYADSFGLSLDKAIEVILRTAEEEKSIEELGPETIDWMNFAVFVNALYLCSNQHGVLNRDGQRASSWHIVDRLIQKCISERVLHAQPILTCPGGDLSFFVQMVSETCAWHALIIQSCIRSLVPSGKKKKKVGPADQLNSPLLQSVCTSIESLHSVIESVKTWIDEQIGRPEDQNIDTLLSHLNVEKCDEGPGRVLGVLKQVSASVDSELGERILQAFQTWSYVDVIRKIVKGQHTVLSEFQRICDSKLKLLLSLKQSISGA